MIRWNQPLTPLAPTAAPVAAGVGSPEVRHPPSTGVDQDPGEETHGDIRRISPQRVNAVNVSPYRVLGNTVQKFVAGEVGSHGLSASR